MPEKAKKPESTPNPEANQELQDALNEVKQELKPEEKTPDYKALADELNDKMLRAVAEAENTRRRADIDVQNAKNYATQSFAKDLLGVLDNLFRASDTITDAEAKENPKLQAIKEGIEITKREMINVFERNGIKRIEPLGQPFDHNFHQAISQIPAPDKTPDTVIEVLQAGYVLKDRLLRPALVVVAKG